MSTDKQEQPKNDLAALIAKANQKTGDMKKTTEKINSKIDDYRKIPLAPLYEINSKGIVRNAKTGQPVTMKKGTGKYYLQTDPKNVGVRKLISPQQIEDSLPKLTDKQTKKEKPVKASGNKKTKEPYTGDLKIADKVWFFHRRYGHNIEGDVMQIRNSSNRPGKFIAVVQDAKGEKYEPTVNEKLFLSRKHAFKKS